MLKVGERISISDELCTIRFIGEIENWVGEITYGLEWDNKERGKHSGEINGISYFSVKVQGSASFMKASKVLREVQSPKTFQEAFNIKYGDDLSDIGSVNFGSKKSSGYGFKELTERNKDFINLRYVSLKRLQISIDFLSDEELDFIDNFCRNITSLDLSYNLISKIDSVAKILSRMKKVESVDLSGNILCNSWENKNITQVKHVKNLKIRGCGISEKHLIKLFHIFPNLTSLDISANHIDQTNFETVLISRSLKELYMIDCLLSRIPKNLSNSTIQKLDISNNIIDTIHNLKIPSLVELNVSDNSLDTWESIDIINENFPNMSSLKMQRNPLINTNQTNFADFYQIVARCENITVLNGSNFDLSTRRDAELFFVSKVSTGEIILNNEFLRHKKLSGLHNFDRVIEKKSNSWLADEFLSLEINISSSSLPNDHILVLSNYSVRFLKSIICSKYTLNLLETKLSILLENGKPERLNREFAQLADYGIKTNDTICVQLTTEAL